MHKRMVQKRVNQCTREELLEWKAHAQKCLEIFQQQNNPYEVEESNYVISLIEKRLSQLGPTE